MTETVDAAAYRNEIDRLHANIADLEADIAMWPGCPDGCGCRLGTEDADARECGCDGPCTMECRENGYPDALSYRDAATAPLRARIAELETALAALAEDWQAASSRYAHMADDAPTDGLQSLYAGRADTYGVCSSKLRLLVTQNDDTQRSTR